MGKAVWKEWRVFYAFDSIAKKFSFKEVESLDHNDVFKFDWMKLIADIGENNMYVEREKGRSVSLPL